MRKIGSFRIAGSTDDYDVVTGEVFLDNLCNQPVLKVNAVLVNGSQVSFTYSSIRLDIHNLDIVNDYIMNVYNSFINQDIDGVSLSDVHVVGSNFNSENT